MLSREDEDAEINRMMWWNNDFDTIVSRMRHLKAAKRPMFQRMHMLTTIFYQITTLPPSPNNIYEKIFLKL
jgi:hypothetical protein